MTRNPVYLRVRLGLIDGPIQAYENSPDSPT